MRKRRSDATYVEDLPPLRRIVPYLMRTRTESAVYFPQRIEVDELLAWLDTTNAGRRPQDRVSLFHVLVTAIARAIRLRPELNRFVVGRRTYQHDDITISFIVKIAMRDDAPETEVRLTFTGTETVEEVRALVEEAVLHKRAEQSGGDDRLVDFFAHWPRPVLNLIARLIVSLDYHNALPRALREAIPLYTSVYLVNVGSIGIAPPFHHLYEHGSASVFVAIGEVSKQPVVDEHGEIVVRSCLDAVYTLDERASDGFYFARAAEVFRRLVSRPELLARPELTIEEILAGWRDG